MKRFLLILTSVILMPLFSSAQQNAGNPLQFDTTIHDFGQVLVSDGALSCSFTATNVSSKPATIQSVTTSCGCTNVKWPHETIQPGKKVTISATYTNDEGPYPFDKTITVNVVEAAKPVMLHLRGIVQKEKKSDAELFTTVFCNSLGFQTDKFKTGNIEQGGSRSDQTTVANLTSKPVKLSFIKVTDGLSLSVTPNPIPAKSHATVHYCVESRPDKWGYNDYCAALAVNGSPCAGTIKVTAFTAENTSGLTREQKAKGSRPIFAESTYSFGHQKQGSVVKAIFTCENKGAATLKVHKVDTDFAGAKPVGTFPEVAPGKKAAFTMSLDTKNLPKGEALVIVTLTTNSPLRPIVTLFLAGWID